MLLAALLVLSLSSTAATDPCPAGSDTWIELSSVPDSLMVPPQFFFDQPTVPLEGLVVCAHGVFFNVHAPQDGKSTEYYISFPEPTREEYRNYVPRDTLLSVRAANDRGYIDGIVQRMMQKNTEGLNKLKADLRRLLGERYVEGPRIDLTKDAAQLSLGFPLTLIWKGESIPFETFPGIYWRRE
jgi:hypothetical protein